MITTAPFNRITTVTWTNMHDSWTETSYSCDAWIMHVWSRNNSDSVGRLLSIQLLLWVAKICSSWFTKEGVHEHSAIERCWMRPQREEFMLRTLSSMVATDLLKYQDTYPSFQGLSNIVRIVDFTPPLEASSKSSYCSDDEDGTASKKLCSWCWYLTPYLKGLHEVNITYIH